MPATINLSHYRGDTFQQAFLIEELAVDAACAENGTPIDLTGYECRMQIRADASDRLTAPLAEFGNTAPLTGITLGSDGMVEIDGGILDVEAGAYAYDIEFKDGDDVVTTHLVGEFIVTDDATHDQP